MVPIVSANLSREIIRGVDANIIVYDSDASYEQFTERLVALMKTVMLREYKTSLCMIYVPSKFMSNLQVEKKLINRFTRENYKNEVFGIEIVPVDYDIMSDMKVLNASAQGMTDKW